MGTNISFLHFDYVADTDTEEILQISDNAYISLVGSVVSTTGMTDVVITELGNTVFVAFSSTGVDNFLIGKTPLGNFSGSIGNVQLWETPFTASQINYSYYNPEKALYVHDTGVLSDPLDPESPTITELRSDNTGVDVADCVSWLPLTEGQGSYVRDMVSYSEGVVNADATSYQGLTGGTNNTNINVDNIFTIHNEIDSTQLYLPFCKISNLNRVEGELYLNTFTINVTSGTAYLREVELDTTNYSIEETLPVGTYTYTFIGNFRDDEDMTLKFNGQAEIIFDATVTIETQKLSGTIQIPHILPDTVAWYNGKGGSKNIQKSANKYDSLGKLIGLANGYTLHGQVPALPIPMTDTELFGGA